MYLPTELHECDVATTRVALLESPPSRTKWHFPPLTASPGPLPGLLLYMFSMCVWSVVCTQGEVPQLLC